MNWVKTTNGIFAVKSRRCTRSKLVALPLLAPLWVGGAREASGG